MMIASFEETARIESMSPLQTGLHFLLGNVFPSIGLLLMLRGSPVTASWQSGAFHDYAAFLLSARSGALFYPFFFYAIACFTLGLFRLELARRWFWIRLGIYSGIPLALQYCFVVGIVLLRVDNVLSWKGFLSLVFAIPLSMLALIGVPWVGWRLLQLLKRYLQRKGGSGLWIAFLTFAGPSLALLFGLMPIASDAESWFFAAAVLPGLIAVIATPVWMTAVYGGLAWRVHRLQRSRFQFPLAVLLGIFSWLAAYMAAWRFAVVETLEAYSALPTSPPSGCYVATTAAQGHPRFVRSWPTRSCRGGYHRVNMQVAYLKCGELIAQ
ncbi:MAG: hypothetical protein WD049_06190, partial [Candidatus Paceibacterota bacterium]